MKDRCAFRYKTRRTVRYGVVETYSTYEIRKEKSEVKILATSNEKRITNNEERRTNNEELKYGILRAE